MFWQDWFTPKSFNSGFLPERDGHLVYFAEFGNKKGMPVIFFHGGPGGSCKAKYAKTINLRKYRAIMIDQRGCGQSQPLGKASKYPRQSNFARSLVGLDFGAVVGGKTPAKSRKVVALAGVFGQPGFQPVGVWRKRVFIP